MSLVDVQEMTVSSAYITKVVGPYDILLEAYLYRTSCL